MVAAEAAACGALPVSAAHSGLAEVTRSLAGAVPAAARELLSFALGDRRRRATSPSASCAGSARRRSCASATRAALVATARERFSWEGVARGVIAAARGAPASDARAALRSRIESPRRMPICRQALRSSRSAAPPSSLLPAARPRATSTPTSSPASSSSSRSAAACHVLNRAGTKGTTARTSTRRSGATSPTASRATAVRGVVRKQIEIPNRMGVDAGEPRQGRAPPPTSPPTSRASPPSRARTAACSRRRSSRRAPTSPRSRRAAS